MTTLLCLEPGCGRLTTKGSRCPEHQRARDRARDRQRGTPTQRGYTSEWLRIVRHAIGLQPWCSFCGVRGTKANPLSGDHIIPLSKGGTNTIENCRILCRFHNSQRGNGSREAKPASELRPALPTFATRQRDRSRRATSVVVHLIGQPCTGKSTLAQHLSLPHFAIDDLRLARLLPGRYWLHDDGIAWCDLEDRVDATSPCVVETAGRTENDRILLDARRVLTVKCTASDDVRRRRLEDRITTNYRRARLNPQYVTQLMQIPASTVAADVVWDTSDEQAAAATLPNLVDVVARWLQELG